MTAAPAGRSTRLRVGVALALALAAAACGWTLHPAAPTRVPGTVLVPVGSGPVRDARVEFGELFCSVLRQDPDLDSPPVDWGACRSYLEGSGASIAPLAPLPATYRVLVVSGIFGECLENSPSHIHAFSQGLAHLRDKHQMVADNVTVSGLGSSASNARQIVQFLTDNPGDYIAIGYSKGASDLMEAVQTSDVARTRIKALVTIAGTVGGSRLADILDEQTTQWVELLLRQTGAPSCQVVDAGGLASLRRSTRQAFLQQYSASVPAFSIVGVSTESTTSKVLQTSWQWLAAYSRDEDSQVISEEGIVPGGTFLGVALADHWAIALPFWEAHDPQTDQTVDRNKFPRTALLEAAVRFAASHIN